ncbi:hypothetical protein [Nocardioides sp. Root151]|uniref:hypothetical protein n=1 Tax=Nocardioides sp. Root151 TaxID=1736475 RepID=UPI0009E77384|nr:hypothetical protein [Nocardioides sp. Root151]
MCRAVRCRACAKTTWSGCGSHIAQVKAGVPDDQWCRGHPDDTRARTSWIRRILHQIEGKP